MYARSVRLQIQLRSVNGLSLRPNTLNSQSHGGAAVLSPDFQCLHQISKLIYSMLL